MRSFVVLFATLFLLTQVEASCTGGDPTIYPGYFTGSQSGQATYYGVYTNGGACTLDPTPPAGTASSTYATVAIATNVWANSEFCGTCLNVNYLGTGSGANPPPSNFLVYVNNECPSCSTNGIDLGLSGDGVWNVAWEAVPCPVGSTNIQFLLQGANSYYIKLQVRNTLYPVYLVEVLQNGAYNALERTADNFFTAGSTVTFPLVFPLTVRVTAATGEQVIDSVASLTNSVVQQGSTQFAACSSAAATATATTTTTAKPTTTTTTAKPTTTTTAKSTTTTTTGTSTTGTQTSTYIYTDSLSSSYQDYSWATVNPSNTFAESGSYSYSFVSTGWAAAYFYATNSIIVPAAGATLQFYVAMSSITTVNFQLVVSDAGVNPITPVTVTKTNSWIQVKISLAAGTYNGLWWQDAVNSGTPTVYLDQIQLIGV